VGNSVLIIPSKGKPTIVTSELEKEKSKTGKIKNIKVPNKPILDYIKKEFPSNTAALSFRHVNLSIYNKLKKQFPNTKFEDFTEVLSQLRIQKTKQEITLIKKECTIANKAFNHITTNFNFKTESDLNAEINHQMEKQGAQPAFPTIVASGPNAALPHHFPTKQKLKSFCIIDFGARYKNYCSDCTRTIFIGTPSTKQKDIYKKVLNSQEKSLTLAKPSTSCRIIDATARKLLKPHQSKFIHSLGHGIGIEVHESPSLSPRSEERLIKNSVVTIEPGIYFPNRFGIRIEDTVLVQSKPKQLTDTSKELLTFS